MQGDMDFAAMSILVYDENFKRKYHSMQVILGRIWAT